jgi:hypothetical protein
MLDHDGCVKGKSDWDGRHCAKLPQPAPHDVNCALDNVTHALEWV